MQSSPPIRFSKGEINRAGKLLLDLRRRVEQHGLEAALAASDEGELDMAWEALTWWRSQHARPLSSVAANLRYHVDQANGRIAGKLEVTQRLKRTPTLIGKLGRHPGTVTQMHDIGGVRAAVPTLPQIYTVRRRLLKSWTIVRERDYIENPKEDGYRALHLVVLRKGFAIEVQIRTAMQNFWANMVEEISRDLRTDYKFGDGDDGTRELLTSVSEVIAAFDRGQISYENLRGGLQWLPKSVIGKTG